MLRFDMNLNPHHHKLRLGTEYVGKISKVRGPIYIIYVILPTYHVPSLHT